MRKERKKKKKKNKKKRKKKFKKKKKKKKKREWRYPDPVELSELLVAVEKETNISLLVETAIAGVVVSLQPE